MPGSVRQWKLVALEKKTSLHLDCWKITDGLAQAGCNMTWPAWAITVAAILCVLYPIEFYWIATINKYFNMGCVTFRSLCILHYRLVLIWWAICEKCHSTWGVLNSTCVCVCVCVCVCARIHTHTHMFRHIAQCCSRGESVHFALACSYKENKCIYTLCNPKTLPRKEMREWAIKYYRWEIMCTWTVSASFSAILLIPLPFTSNGSRAHKFAPDYSNKWVTISVALSAWLSCM
jgi:hypothetical protein